VTRLMGLILLALAAGACEGAVSARPAVGAPAPAYSARTLEGEELALTDLRGSVVLLNVWATWCPPCRKEIPELQELHEAHSAEGLEVVGVSVDAAGADPQVRAFMREFGMTYTVLRDPGDRAAATFVLHGVPATFLIDRQGVIRWQHLGPFTADDPGLQEALRSALGG
jgi:cytochrome c biogenesis protein CcmG, thiol:disulfide interchange protein DsbE